MPKTRTTPAVPDRDADVFGMDPAQTLGALLAGQAKERAGAAQKMRAATHWADLHRVTDGIPSALDPQIAELLAPDATIAGCEGKLRLAGQGAFAVEEFAVCELASALGMSEPAARAYVGQALEVRDRLPRCWASVMAGQLPDWKARQIAEHTIPLGAEAAAYVDAQLAPFAHKLSLGRVLACIEAAVVRFEPDLAAERAAAAAERRGVWAEDRAGGISELRAVADTPDVHALDAALNSVAATLGTLGDPESHDTRRAKALGVLADPQYALDLLTDPDTARTTSAAGRPTMHLHLHTDSLPDLTAHSPRGGTPSAEAAGVGGGTPSAGNGAVARVDGIGPQTLQAVRRWLTGLAPGASITLTPVVNLTEHISVDAYEVPDRLRAQVEHRDLGCVFPWCGRRGRFDVDHIDPYDFGDPDLGRAPPPGQTSTSHTARLCRFHHRVKTHSDWTYYRTHPTSVEWTSPHGRRYIVDHTGTTSLS